MKKWLQRKFINLLTRHLFNGVTEHDILIIPKKGVIVYKGRVLTPEHSDKIKNDASIFANSVLWKHLRDDAKFQANKMMFEKSESAVDINNGKIMLYLLEVIDKKMRQLSNN